MKDFLIKNKFILAGSTVALVVVIGISLVWFYTLSSKTSSASATTTPSISAEIVSAIRGGFFWFIPKKSVEAVQYPYIEITDSCGPDYVGECVHMRSGAGTKYPSVAKLRTGVVLKVTETVTVDGHDWYKIGFATELRYPERVAGDLFVSADVAKLFFDDGDHLLVKGESATTTKRIVIDTSEQTLYAYDGDTLFMKETISTGKEFTPTPRGTFAVYKMTPSRYMQGPIEGVSDQYYDLPGVPWNLYFTQGGAVIHGAYWHDNFGEPWSHGCVNLSIQKAKELYTWAEVGTKVVVQD